MSKNQHQTPKTLNLFSLTLINIAFIGSVNYWSFLAGYGLSAIFFFILAAILFFIPLSLVASELSSTWHDGGGLYVWIKKAFGRRAGFVATWLLWVQSTLWIPVPLMWVGQAWKHTFFPQYPETPIYHLILSLTLLWVTTLLLLYGMKVLRFLTVASVIIGFFIPGTLIIVLGFIWFFQGQGAPFFTVQELHQDLASPKKLALFTAVIYSLVGLEMSSFHARSVKDPKKTYPKSIFLAALIFSVMTLLGALALNFVLPEKEFHFFTATTQALSKLLSHFHVKWLFPLFTFLVGIGIYSMILNWLAGPIKGLLRVANDGDLPPRLRRVNAHQMPTTLLIIQAVIISILTTSFILISNIHNTYWILLSLITLLYFIIYTMLFASAIRLRYKSPNVERPYKIPGKTIGLWIVCGLGFLSSIGAFCFGFILPAETVSLTSNTFFLLLAFGTVFICLIPWFILLFKKPNWVIHE